MPEASGAAVKAALQKAGEAQLAVAEKAKQAADQAKAPAEPAKPAK